MSENYYEDPVSNPLSPTPAIDVRMKPGAVALGVNEMVYLYDIGDPLNFPKIGGVPKALVVATLRALADEIERSK